MANIYHILGTDIPHHNHTVLAFFQNELLKELAEKPTFYLVSKEDLAEQFPQLNLHVLLSQRALTQAIIAKYKEDPTACFMLHGQFNISLWLAIWFGQIPAKRCVWHIWGADLYESSRALKFRLFYPLRRIIQRKIARFYATRGDLAYAHQKFDRTGFLDRVLYFPTKIPKILPKRSHSETLKILLGNSGDPSNLHLQGLEELKTQFGDDVHIVIPMGYPQRNQKYIAQVCEKAKALFRQEQVTVLTEKMSFEAYLALLAQCDLGYFPFERQQGIGTICLLTLLNIPVALSRQNPFQLDLQAENVTFLFTNEVCYEAVRNAQKHLDEQYKGEISFLPPNYKEGWIEVLNELSHWKGRE